MMLCLLSTVFSTVVDMETADFETDDEALDATAVDDATAEDDALDEAAILEEAAACSAFLASVVSLRRAICRP